MNDFSSLGKMILIFGLMLLIIGALMIGAGKFLDFGKLPGDIVYRKGNFTLFVPIVSSILLSIVLTIILNFLLRR